MFRQLSDDQLVDQVLAVRELSTEWKKRLEVMRARLRRGEPLSSNLVRFSPLRCRLCVNRVSLNGRPATSGLPGLADISESAGMSQRCQYRTLIGGKLGYRHILEYPSICTLGAP